MMSGGNDFPGASEEENPSVICFAVFPWSWDWEMRTDIYESFFDLHRRYIFRVDLFCYLSDRDVMAINLCCKDAYAMYLESLLPGEVDREWFEYHYDSDP